MKKRISCFLVFFIMCSSYILFFNPFLTSEIDDPLDYNNSEVNPPLSSQSHDYVIPSSFESADLFNQEGKQRSLGAFYIDTQPENIITTRKNEIFGNTQSFIKNEDNVMIYSDPTYTTSVKTFRWGYDMWGADAHIDCSYASGTGNPPCSYGLYRIGDEAEIREYYPDYETYPNYYFMEAMKNDDDLYVSSQTCDMFFMDGDIRVSGQNVMFTFRVMLTFTEDNYIRDNTFQLVLVGDASDGYVIGDVPTDLTYRLNYQKIDDTFEMTDWIHVRDRETTGFSLNVGGQLRENMKMEGNVLVQIEIALDGEYYLTGKRLEVNQIFCKVNYGTNFYNEMRWDYDFGITPYLSDPRFSLSKISVDIVHEPIAEGFAQYYILRNDGNKILLEFLEGKTYIAVGNELLNYIWINEATDIAYISVGIIGNGDLSNFGRFNTEFSIDQFWMTVEYQIGVNINSSYYLDYDISSHTLWRFDISPLTVPLDNIINLGITVSNNYQLIEVRKVSDNSTIDTWTFTQFDDDTKIIDFGTSIDEALYVLFYVDNSITSVQDYRETGSVYGIGGNNKYYSEIYSSYDPIRVSVKFDIEILTSKTNLVAFFYDSDDTRSFYVNEITGSGNELIVVIDRANVQMMNHRTVNGKLIVFDDPDNVTEIAYIKTELFDVDSSVLNSETFETNTTHFLFSGSMTSGKTDGKLVLSLYAGSSATDIDNMAYEDYLYDDLNYEVNNTLGLESLMINGLLISEDNDDFGQILGRKKEFTLKINNTGTLEANIRIVSKIIPISLTSDYYIGKTNFSVIIPISDDYDLTFDSALFMDGNLPRQKGIYVIELDIYDRNNILIGNLVIDNDYKLIVSDTYGGEILEQVIFNVPASTDYYYSFSMLKYPDASKLIINYYDESLISFISSNQTSIGGSHCPVFGQKLSTPLSAKIDSVEPLRISTRIIDEDGDLSLVKYKLTFPVLDRFIGSALDPDEDGIYETNWITATNFSVTYGVEYNDFFISNYLEAGWGQFLVSSEDYLVKFVAKDDLDNWNFATYPLDIRPYIDLNVEEGNWNLSQYETSFIWVFKTWANFTIVNSNVTANEKLEGVINIHGSNLYVPNKFNLNLPNEFSDAKNYECKYRYNYEGGFLDKVNDQLKYFAPEVENGKLSKWSFPEHVAVSVVTFNYDSPTFVLDNFARDLDNSNETQSIEYYVTFTSKHDFVNVTGTLESLKFESSFNWKLYLLVGAFYTEVELEDYGFGIMAGKYTPKISLILPMINAGETYTFRIVGTSIASDTFDIEPLIYAGVIGLVVLMIMWFFLGINEDAILRQKWGNRFWVYTIIIVIAITIVSYIIIANLPFFTNR